MPKKPNHAGQMQNYVPKGNGDASGDYDLVIHKDGDEEREFAKEQRERKQG